MAWKPINNKYYSLKTNKSKINDIIWEYETRKSNQYTIRSCYKIYASGIERQWTSEAKKKFNNSKQQDEKKKTQEEEEEKKPKWKKEINK